MSRLGHYLKPGVRASAPGVLFSVVVDPQIESGARTERDTFHTWGGADVCVSHWRRGRWTRTRGARCETPAALAKWMSSHADRKRRNFVISPDASGALAMGDVWETIDSGPVVWVPPGTFVKKAKRQQLGDDGTIIRRIVVSPTCTILDYTRRELRWVWLSAGQYFTAPEEELAAAFGHQWDTEPCTPVPGKYLHRFAAERSKMWLAAFQELTSWWRANAKAPFGLTASSLSLGILRSHIQDKTLCSHSHEWAHRLEREACYGGMARTWYYGDIDHPCEFGTEDVPAPSRSRYGSIEGPLTLVDVRSMYPWLLREERYPQSLTSYREDRHANEPQQYAEATGVIARVTIETEVPEYPCRSGQNIIYPIGRFTTTLTGPELLRLKREGRVVKCHAMALYHLGRPFREAAAALIEMRERARAEGRPAWELFAKAIGNGLGGKLAQRKGEWIELPNHRALVPFGEWYECSRTTGRSARYRAIASCVSKYERDITGAGPYTSAFAYLAALGRLHMRGIRDVCPEQSVVSMDTDGFWVRSDGAVALEKQTRCGNGRAGELRVVEHVAAARFFGPRHYFTPSGWVLSGFANATVGRGGQSISDTVRFAPLASPAGRAPRGVCVRARTSDLAVEAHGVRIGKDGWTIPYRRRGLLSK